MLLCWTFTLLWGDFIQRTCELQNWLNLKHRTLRQKFCTPIHCATCNSVQRGFYHWNDVVSCHIIILYCHPFTAMKLTSALSSCKTGLVAVTLTINLNTRWRTHWIFNSNFLAWNFFINFNNFSTDNFYQKFFHLLFQFFQISSN